VPPGSRHLTLLPQPPPLFPLKATEHAPYRAAVAAVAHACLPAARHTSFGSAEPGKHCHCLSLHCVSVVQREDKGRHATASGTCYSCRHACIACLPDLLSSGRTWLKDARYLHTSYLLYSPARTRLSYAWEVQALPQVYILAFATFLPPFTAALRDCGKRADLVVPPLRDRGRGSDAGRRLRLVWAVHAVLRYFR